MGDIYDIEEMKKRVEEEKGSPEVTRDLIDMTQNKCMIQPVLFLQGNDKKTDDLIDFINDNALLHSAPLEATSVINGQLAKNISTSPEYAEKIKDFEGYLYSVKSNTIIEEVTRYITQNVLISFCNMIDWTGPIFTEIVSNIPLKAYVSDTLNDTERNGIRSFVSRYVHDFSKASYQYCFNPSHNDSKPYLESLIEKNRLTGIELSQIIYHNLCKACDNAITEAFLGTRNTPNLKYLLQIGCKYFGIKFTGLDNRQELYIKLNATLVHMIDELMQAVIVPMSNNLFIGSMFASYFFSTKLVYNEEDQFEY